MQFPMVPTMIVPSRFHEPPMIVAKASHTTQRPDRFMRTALFAQPQTSCSPAADHTFSPTIQMVRFWAWAPDARDFLERRRVNSPYQYRDLVRQILER